MATFNWNIGAIGKNPYEKAGMGAGSYGVSGGASGGISFGGSGGFGGVGVEQPKGMTSEQLVAKFDAMDAKTLGADFRNGGVKPEESSLGVAGYQAQNTEINPFANVEAVQPVPPAQQVANGGNQQLQQALAGIGTGELNPVVDNNQVRTLCWA